ncbi:reverse transcriptase domain-containing protein [Tanacetum coccineum]
MRTRSSLEYTIPRRRNCRRSRHRQEAIPLILDPIPMADDRPMAEQLQAPTGGYLTTPSILLLFPFSLDGVAKTWLDKEPPNSILTWDDLVSKFINFFFPPSKTTNLRNEITNFRQIAQESFSEAWERFKELLRKCPHHGFSLMHQLDTFYNSLSYNDQDSLNSAAGGNFLYKSPTEGLQIIENKAKVRCSERRDATVEYEKKGENDKVQIQKFWEMFKKIHVNITLADALILMPKYQKMLKSLLSNKEKLNEMAYTRELKCKALADLGASINLMPFSVYTKLGLPALQSTRMTLELANCSLCVPKGIARDVLVPVGRLTFPADFVVVDFECDYRVPLILGRPFLRTARVLIDVHGEELVIRDGMERIVFKPDGSQDKESIHMMDIYDDRFKDVCEPESNDSSSPTSTIVEEFDSLVGEIIKQKEERFNELALMCPRMVEPERMKVDAYIRRLTNNIKGEVTSSKPANLNKSMRLAYKLMEQKSQARDERILEGKKRKWESFQSGNSSGKGYHRDN